LQADIFQIAFNLSATEGKKAVFFTEKQRNYANSKIDSSKKDTNCIKIEHLDFEERFR